MSPSAKESYVSNLRKIIEQSQQLYEKQENLAFVHNIFKIILDMYQMGLDLDEDLPKHPGIQADIKWIVSKKEELEHRLKYDKTTEVQEPKRKRDRNQYYPEDPKVPEWFVGMDELKKELDAAIITDEKIEFMKNQGVTEHVTQGMRPQEILLYGDKGCGKSTVAEWVAERLGYKIIKIQCHDLYWFWNENPRLMMWEMFELAKKTKGCVILLDEVEALESGKRPDFEDLIGKTF